jgi:hypothetical protein
MPLASQSRIKLGSGAKYSQAVPAPTLHPFAFPTAGILLLFLVSPSRAAAHQRSDLRCLIFSGLHSRRQHPSDWIYCPLPRINTNRVSPCNPPSHPWLLFRAEPLLLPCSQVHNSQTGFWTGLTPCTRLTRHGPHGGPMSFSTYHHGRP